MQLTHLGHSAVLVQTGSVRMLIDPGNLSDAWHGLTDLDAVLVTHQHADHIDPENAAALVTANPAAKVLVEPSVLDAVPLAGAEAFGTGSTATLGDITVTAVGGQHAIIHADLPTFGNVGLVLSAAGEPTLFHPGDALAAIPAGIDVLAVPAYGPWAAMKETIDFVRAVGAPQGFCVHDRLLAEPGFQLVNGRLGAMSGTEMLDLRGGQPHSF